MCQDPCLLLIFDTRQCPNCRFWCRPCRWSPDDFGPITRQACHCFFHLWQLCSIRQSLNNDSAATVVHAFVASRVDYCDSLLIGTSKKLQHVLNAGAKIVSNNWKYNQGLSRFRWDKLHWLDVDKQVQFNVCPAVLPNLAPGYVISLTHVPRHWSPASAIRSTTRTELPPYQPVHVQGSSICLCWTNNIPDDLKNVSHAILRPFSFLPTSTFSKFEVLY